MRVMSAWDDWDAQRSNVVQLPLRAEPARLPDPATIPPRPWLYGTMLLRGFVTVLVAPGGTGKTQVAMAIGLAVAAKEPILGHHVHHQANAWLLNLEDPLDEMDRRLAALTIHHRISRDQLAGVLFLHSGRSRRVCIAKRDAEGHMIVFPDREEIVSECLRLGIGLLVVDPYVKSHELAENNNEEMDAAATAWAEVAEQANCAVLLVHHVRKGPVVSIDAARGAVSLIDASRAAFILQTMTEEEAVELNVAKEERWRHVRMDDGKVNMAPRATVAQWYRMEMVPLRNATSDYPKGDQVAAIAPWAAPDVWKEHDAAALNAALDLIDEGHPDGGLYVAHKRGRANSRWAGAVLVDQLGVSEGQASKMIATWLTSGTLFEQEFHHPEQRRDKVGVRSNVSLRPTT